MDAVAFYVGAVLGIVLISRIPIWALGVWKAQSFPRLLLAHLITYLLAAVGYAYGAADGGSPKWEMGFLSYALPSLVVVILDAIGLFRTTCEKQRNAQDYGADTLEWFVHVNGQDRGPLKTTTIRASLAQGTLQPEDWIWRDGFENWTQIQDIAFLSGASESKMEVPGRTSSGSRRANYFIRHWRGELSLPVSYWVNSLAFVPPTIAASVAFSQVSIADYPRLVSVSLIGFWLLVVIGQVWLSVGIWRSADQYTKMRPLKIWGGAAKFMTVLACLSTFSTFARDGIPQINGLTEIIAQANQERYTLRLLRDDTELEIGGPLDFGLTKLVEDTLDRNHKITTIHLNSVGGRLAEAEKLAELILRKDLNTYVSTTCMSACVNVFAAGKNRWISRHAIIGLHEPYFPGLGPAELEAMAEQSRSFLLARGVSATFVNKGLSYSHDSLWKPSHSELFSSRLATSYATESGVAMSGLPADNFDGLDAELRKVPIFSALKDFHPQEYDKVVVIFKKGIHDGRSLTELRAETMSVVQPLLARIMPSASDEALLRFYSVVVEELDGFSRASSQACEAFAKGDAKGFEFGSLSKELQARDLEVSALLIRSQDQYRGGAIDIAMVTNEIAGVVAGAAASGFGADEFNQGLQFMLTPEKNCLASIIFFKGVLNLESGSRSRVLRYLTQAGPEAPL